MQPREARRDEERVGAAAAPEGQQAAQVEAGQRVVARGALRRRLQALGEKRCHLNLQCRLQARPGRGRPTGHRLRRGPRRAQRGRPAQLAARGRPGGVRCNLTMAPAAMPRRPACRHTASGAHTPPRPGAARLSWCARAAACPSQSCGQQGRPAGRGQAGQQAAAAKERRGAWAAGPPQRWLGWRRPWTGICAAAAAPRPIPPEHSVDCHLHTRLGHQPLGLGAAVGVRPVPQLIQRLDIAGPPAQGCMRCMLTSQRGCQGHGPRPRRLRLQVAGGGGRRHPPRLLPQRQAALVGLIRQLVAGRHGGRPPGGSQRPQAIEVAIPRDRAPLAGCSTSVRCAGAVMPWQARWAASGALGRSSLLCGAWQSQGA